MQMMLEVFLIELKAWNLIHHKLQFKAMLHLIAFVFAFKAFSFLIISHQEFFLQRNI